MRLFTAALSGGFFYGCFMQELQQQIYNVLQQNAGNRLTAELINGLTARLHAIAKDQAMQSSKKEC